MPGKKLFKQMLVPQLFQNCEEMERIIDGYGLLKEWKYYKDGKSWRCKVTNKKRQ